VHPRGDAQLPLCFFLVAPFAFWLDDAIGFLAYHEQRPDKLHVYYLRLFKWEFLPEKVRAQM
jgi:hypothetical protein